MYQSCQQQRFYCSTPPMPPLPAPLRSDPARPRPPPPARKKIQKKRIGLLCSLKPPCRGCGSQSGIYSTTSSCSHRTATAAGLTSLQRFSVFSSHKHTFFSFCSPVLSDALGGRGSYFYFVVVLFSCFLFVQSTPSNPCAFSTAMRSFSLRSSNDS